MKEFRVCKNERKKIFNELLKKHPERKGYIQKMKIGIGILVALIITMIFSDIDVAITSISITSVAFFLIFLFVSKRIMFTDYIWKKCNEEIYLFDDKIENRYIYNQQGNQINMETEESLKGLNVFLLEIYYKDIKKIIYNTYHNRFILECEFKITYEGKYLNGRVKKEKMTDNKYNAYMQQGRSLFYMYYENSEELLNEIIKRSGAEFIKEDKINPLHRKLQDKEFKLEQYRANGRLNINDGKN